jgi:DNA-binding MarR family transcriptional regulator
MRGMNEATRRHEASGDRFEPRISYVIARLERALRMEINARVRPHGLTTLQYTTLSILGQGGRLSNAQLARRAYMTPQSMSEVLRALERKGLVDRTSGQAFGRALPAELTAEGRRVLDACGKAVDALEHEMLRDLTPRQARTMRTSLVDAVRGVHAGFPRR